MNKIIYMDGKRINAAYKVFKEARKHFPEELRSINFSERFFSLERVHGVLDDTLSYACSEEVRDYIILTENPKAIPLIVTWAIQYGQMRNAKNK